MTITAELDGAKAEKAYTVVANPVAVLDLAIAEETIRTGDVIKLVGAAKRADGAAVTDAPITWSYTYTAPEGNTPKAPGGAGIIDNGLFVANYPGMYTILASSGSANARKTIEVTPRDVRRRISIVGRGKIYDTHTSDLWPYTGKDGRDYCIVGTWGGDGYAHVFDITDLSNIVKTHSMKVDARTINDVTVSPDARYAVMSREGASNRTNGVVFLDLADPAHPKVSSTFDIELTGGVHNMFATKDHLFAVSGGSKYVIINAEDIYKPAYVSEYRHPNARLHDLWVHDGIAYSAQGGVGTVVVDVGNGKYGGSLKAPKLINTVPINSGHEIYPYVQKSTGKVYLFIGDEEMSRRGPRLGRHELSALVAWRRPAATRRHRADVWRLHAHRRFHRSDEPAQGRPLSPRGLRLARHHRRERHPVSGVLRRRRARGRCLGHAARQPLRSGPRDRGVQAVRSRRATRRTRRS